MKKLLLALAAITALIAAPCEAAPPVAVPSAQLPLSGGEQIFANQNGTVVALTPDGLRRHTAKRLPVAVSGAYTLVGSDQNSIIYCTAACTLTIPAKLFETGSTLQIQNLGTGTMTLAGAAISGSIGALNLNDVAAGSVAFSSQYSGATVFFSDSYHAYYTVAQGSTIVDSYTTAGTYTWPKRAGLVSFEVTAVSGGAGGGSARRGSTTTIRAGGGGGCGGGWTFLSGSAALLNATENVTVGVGGTGGAAPTTDDTDGSTGTGGGNSTFGGYTSDVGGGSGPKGTAFASGTCTVGYGEFVGTIGGGSSTSAASSTPITPAGFACGSGGAGGSATAANALLAASSGSNPGQATGGDRIGGAAGSGAAGTTVSDRNINDTRPNAGGGGGSGSTTGGGFAGGNGGAPCGGGGGAGEGIDGFTGGAGGNGGVGRVIVISHF